MSKPLIHKQILGQRYILRNWIFVHLMRHLKKLTILHNYYITISTLFVPIRNEIEWLYK